MIHQLPPVLILHMKRFEISQYRVIKDSRYVSFPEILDMAPYCTDDCVKVRIHMSIAIQQKDLSYIITYMCIRAAPIPGIGIGPILAIFDGIEIGDYVIQVPILLLVHH